MKTLIQCDFDGTITEKDVSFLLLDAFADGDWRALLRQYQAGEITVNHFNKSAFAMVKADKHTLLQYARGRVKVREGFVDLVNYCRRRGFKFVVVSNGQKFYINAFLEKLGIGGVDVFAAKTEFTPDGVKASYIGPDGNTLESGFKETYVRLFSDEGYHIVYVGNGISDLAPARLAHYVFATSELLQYCRQENLDCIPFDGFSDITNGLECLPLD